MGPKRKEPKTPPDEPEEAQSGKPVRLELEPKYHIAFRVAAAQRGVYMSALAREIIKEWLEKQTDVAIQLWLQGDLSKEGADEQRRKFVEALKNQLT